MFDTRGGGGSDRLTEFTAPLDGSHHFVPSLEPLAALPTERAPQGARMLSKRVWWSTKASSTLPVGPLRCFAMRISAIPRSGDSAL